MFVNFELISRGGGGGGGSYLYMNDVVGMCRPNSPLFQPSQIYEWGGGQEGGLVTDHRDLKHKITNHRVFK